MLEIKEVAFVVRNDEDLWECTRSALGLAVENFYVSLFVLDFEVEFTDALKENMEWLQDLEVSLYSNSRTNTDNGHFRYRGFSEIAESLNHHDLVITF
jgi:hypothetical protein